MELVEVAPGRWIATRFEPDGEYVEEFQAPGVPEAQAHCAERGWRLDGRIGMSGQCSEADIPELQAITDALNKRAGTVSH
jgi:hypothetical protein